MSAPTAAIPGTSARAVGFVAIVGVVALTAYEPTAGVGALSGAVLAGAVALATGSRSHALPAALLPVGVFGVLGAVALATEGAPLSLLLTVMTVPIGVGAAVVLLGGGSASQLEQVGDASLHAAVVGCVCTILALWTTAAAGSAAEAVDTALTFTGPGSVGLGAAFLIAGIAIATGLLLLPPATFTTPRRRTEGIAARNSVAGATVVAFGVLGLFVAVVGFATGGGFGGLGDWVVPRALLTALTAAGLAVAAAALLARWSWYGDRQSHNPTLAVFAGTLVGFGLAGAGLLALGGLPTADAWTGLFALGTVVFGGGWLVCTRYAAQLKANAAPSAPTVVALSLCLGGVAVGAGINLTRGALTGAGVGGIATLVAVAAGLYVYRLGRFGRTLGREVGTAGATRRPQLVHAGWLGVVSLLGLTVAVGGVWVATIFAPALSVPATAGVLAGTVALFAGIWLLFRRA